MDLVLQGEVEGEVLDAFVVVDLHSGGVLVGLKVLDHIREPHGEPVEPGQTMKGSNTPVDRTHDLSTTSGTPPCTPLI